jgi:hypothetical protein
VSAPGRKRLERSPSRSKGQSPTATSREDLYCMISKYKIRLELYKTDSE